MESCRQEKIQLPLSEALYGNLKYVLIQRRFDITDGLSKWITLVTQSSVL